MQLKFLRLKKSVNFILWGKKEKSGCFLPKNYILHRIEAKNKIKEIEMV